MAKKETIMERLARAKPGVAAMESSARILNLMEERVRAQIQGKAPPPPPPGTEDPAAGPRRRKDFYDAVMSPTAPKPEPHPDSEPAQEPPGAPATPTPAPSPPPESPPKPPQKNDSDIDISSTKISSVRPVVCPSVRPMDCPLDTRLDRRVDTRLDRRVDRRLDTRLDTRDEGRGLPLSTPVLTKNQYSVLRHLLTHEGITRLQDIVDDTSVPYGSVRHVLRALSEKGILKEAKKYVNSGYQGITYKLDDEVGSMTVSVPSDETPGRKVDRRLDRHMDTRLDRRVDRRVDTRSADFEGTPIIAFSSSSIDTEKTASRSGKPGQNDSEYEMRQLEISLAGDPELVFWQEQGLTPKQVLRWLRTTPCNLLDCMLEYLRYAAYALSNPEEGAKPVEKPIGWFYTIIARTGEFTRPKHYKSHQARQLEHLQRIRAEHENEARRLAEAREELARAKQTKRFERMLGRPDSPEYQLCLSKIDSYSKKRVGSPAFVKAMRAAFDAL